MSKQNEVMQQIADNVIKMMKEHGSDWTKPWRKAVGNTGEPISAKKRFYSGINRLNLGLVIALSGYSSPVFATFKQWKSLGASVRKGSKGVPVFFYKPTKITDKDTKEVKIIPIAKSYVVFNADQVDGWNGSWLEQDAEELEQEWDDVLSADQIINACGANILHTKGDRAFYRPASDTITLPTREQFADASGYYGTAFHELVHWTGAEKRLDREKGKRFADERYAFEELVAELGAAMLSNVAKVDIEPAPHHAQYLNNWIACLQDHSSAIVKAASLAEKAAQFILDAAKNEDKQAA